MKKIYALGLFFVMLVCAGFQASALTVTIEWDIPGSVEIRPESRSDAPVALSPDQTSYVYETSASYGYCYVTAADGYKLISAATTDGSVTYSPVTYYSPNFILGSLGSAEDGKTIKVVCEKIVRENTFTIDVVNGLDYLTAKFTGTDYTLDLKAGENTYIFNPSIDNPLQISLQGISEAYSVTLNGTPVEKNSWYARYDVTVTDNSVLKIQVVENESDLPKKCLFTIDYGSDMEGCLFNIYNRTFGYFIEPKDLVDNSVEIIGKSELRVNLIEDDYTYSKFTLNGEDITDSYKNGSVTFTLPNENSVLRIEGTKKAVTYVDFTGYIVNPEAVDFRLTYSGDNLEKPETEAIDNDITVDGIVFPKDATKKVVISVPEKTGQIFFSVENGYYISTLYCTLAGKTEVHSGSMSINAKNDGTTFYMYVDKLPASYPFNVTTTGDELRATVKSSNPIINMWDNPEGISVELSPGEKEYSFIPGYETPLVFSFMGTDTASPAVYLDGAPVTGTTNSNSGAKDFEITPYSPVEGSAIAEGVQSTVSVYNSSTSRPTMSGASLQLEDGLQAEFFYSPVRHIADAAGQQVISGTQMIVKPASTDVIITYKDEEVALDANGEFVFNATGNARNNVVVISLPKKYVDIAVTPADGATVKCISTLKITVPNIDPNFEKMMEADADVLTTAAVKNADETLATVAEMEEPTSDEEGNIIYTLVLSESVTEAGEYTIDIPEGAFVEKAWSDADEAFVPVSGGYISASYVGTVTVDPNMISILDDYTLDPESGATVKEISVVAVTFNQIPSYEYFSNWEFPNAEFTNGTETVQAIVNYDWSSEGENRVMNVMPVDENEEFTTISTPGNWTLTIAAGTFTLNGEENSEIIAKYTIDADAPAYILAPASGSDVDNLSKISITFPDVTEVEYNELPILIDGPEYNASSVEVFGIGNTRTVSFRNPTAEGKYTVTFPAGAFTLDGNASEETIAFYNFACSWALTPAPGSVIEEFSNIVLTFPKATKVEMVGSETSMMLTNGNSYATPYLECVKDETAAVPTFILSLPREAQVPPVGTYTLVIEEGVFDVDGKESVEINAEYTIEHDVTTGYIQTPDGTIVYQDYGFDFAFIFDETSTITSPAKSAVHITLDDEEIPASAYDMMAEGNMLMFMVFDPNYCKAGTLRVKIDEGAFRISNVSNAAIEATWNVVAPKTYTVVVTPEAPESGKYVNDLSVIYIYFPEATSGEVFNEYGVSLRKPDYSYSQTGTMTLVDEGEEGVKFMVTFNPAPTTAGTYNFEAREGSFTLDGSQASPEILISYAFDKDYNSIAGIYADENGNVTVYTLDGRAVLVDAPADKVKDLDNGFYIINGQKVCIK